MVIVWNRIDQPGKEWCQLRQARGLNILEGFVVMTYDGRPCRLEYFIDVTEHGRRDAQQSKANSAGRQSPSVWKSLQRRNGDWMGKRFRA